MDVEQNACRVSSSWFDKIARLRNCISQAQTIYLAKYRLHKSPCSWPKPWWLKLSFLDTPIIVAYCMVALPWNG